MFYVISFVILFLRTTVTRKCDYIRKIIQMIYSFFSIIFRKMDTDDRKR